MGGWLGGMGGWLGRKTWHFSDFWRGASARAKNRKKSLNNFGRNFGGISAKIPAEWVAGSAEWVAGSAVKLGIFSDFWRGASARAKNRKK